MLGFSRDRDAGGDDAFDDLSHWRRLIPVALGVALALALGLLFVLANRAAEDREEALTLQRHSYEVIAVARTVERSVARAHALIGRYAVSLDANGARRYADEWRQAGALIDTLRRATRGDSMQRHNLAILQ